MSLPEFLTNTSRYQEAFVAGLETMLDHEDLGVFILVLANASYDADIFDVMKSRLFDRFQVLTDRLKQGSLQAPDDDLSVFARLQDIGLDRLALTQFRRVGAWELQYNQLRSFRPPRISNERVDSLQQPFNNEAFHFNKPFLKKERLWQGQWLGRDMRMLYNKFPFADYHALLVIEPDSQLPQFLTRDVHDMAVTICEQCADSMPQVGLGYNAFGAAASVNHLHLQLYARSSGQYPIESNNWQHNGGQQPYPLDCRRFENHDEAWQYITHLHTANKAYNLIYRPGLVYVVIRKMQGHFTPSDKLAGIGWTDVAGSVTVFTQHDFEHLGTGFMQSEYHKVALFDD